MSPTFNPIRVELDTGIVTAAMQHGVTTRWLPELIGKRRYWVDLVEADGGRLCLWDGDHEADAIREANEARIEWAITAPVVMLGQGGGNALN